MTKPFALVLAFLLCAHFSAAGYITFTYGGRANKLYVPNSYDPNDGKSYPLFVLLHGCTQDPDQFSRGTKMNTYGEQYGLFVLYPLQPSTANLNKCWNWFEIAHQSRGTGEPAFIAGAAAAVAAQYNINSDEVFCAGLSAGGAMTAIMGATYPDVFRSLGVAAGLEYKAALNTLAAFTAMRQGGPPAKTQGTVAWNAMSPNYVEPIEVLVVQGTSDFTVYPVNGLQTTEQWVWSNNLGLGDETRIPITPSRVVDGQVPGGRRFTENQYSDTQTGTILGRYIVVDAMGHAWSGGDITGSYTDPRGPDMSLMMIEWFLQGAIKLNATSVTY